MKQPFVCTVSWHMQKQLALIAECGIIQRRCCERFTFEVPIWNLKKRGVNMTATFQEQMGKQKIAPLVTNIKREVIYR